MQFSSAHKTSIYTALVFAILFVVVFGFPAMATYHHDGMPMSNCSFMVAQTALCAMNAVDHLASWQAMFASLPVESFGLTLSLLVISLGWILWRYLFYPPDVSPPAYTAYGIETYTPSFRVFLLGSVISPRAP